MKKSLAFLAALVAVTTALSACSERVVYLTPEQAKARQEAEAQQERDRLAPIQRQMPAGCEFKDLGGYRTYAGTWIAVSAVFCGKTTSTHSTWQSGKSHNYATLTTVNE